MSTLIESGKKKFRRLLVYNYYFLRYPKLSRIYEKFKTYTMLPKGGYIRNLSVAKKFGGKEGCIVECGTWRGGMIAGMAAVYGKGRKYYLFDSFEGLPPATDTDGDSALAWQKDTASASYYNNCKAEMSFAEEAMKLAGATNFEVVKGWFNETLPAFDKDNKIAVLRLDGDWYESTMACLDNLYGNVVEGGLIIIDDYYTWTGCAKAVHHFLSKNSLNERVSQWDNDVCYIIKRINS